MGSREKQKRRARKPRSARNAGLELGAEADAIGLRVGRGDRTIGSGDTGIGDGDIVLEVFHIALHVPLMARRIIGQRQVGRRIAGLPELSTDGGGNEGVFVGVFEVDEEDDGRILTLINKSRNNTSFP